MCWCLREVSGPRSTDVVHEAVVQAGSLEIVYERLKLERQPHSLQQKSLLLVFLPE